MTSETALTGWALALAYAFPIGLILALVAQMLRSRAERRRAAEADRAMQALERSLGQMKARPDAASEDGSQASANGAGQS